MENEEILFTYIETSYPIIVERKSNIYKAFINNMEDCNACGDTVQRVITNIQENLELYLQHYIKENKKYPEVNRTMDWRLSSGTFLTESKKIGFLLDAKGKCIEMYNKIEEI